MESTTQTINATSHLPKIDDYLTPVTKETIATLSNKVSAIVNIFKSKLQDDSTLFISDSEIEVNIEGVHIKKEDLNTENKYNFILESKSFIHKADSMETGENKSRELNKDYFKDVLNSLNDKSMALFVMDYHYLIQVPKVLEEYIANSQVNILLKLYVVEKLPLIGVFSIQKFEKSKCEFNSLKLLTYEMYDDYSITKPVSYHLHQLPHSLAYMYEMFQYQGYLSELTPGNIVKINVRENFWSDNVDYTLTVVDSNDKDLIEMRTCFAIIVTKSYANDFIYLTAEGNMQLCQQVKASRIILIRPNAFNSDSVQEIKEKISHYIALFRFRNVNQESTPIMLMSDSKNDTYEMYREKDFFIRDMVESDKKETFRQLVFTNNESETQSEVKLVLTTKSKAKANPDTYIQLPTLEKYKEKNLVSCLDQNFICSFYIKSVLTGIFFVDSSHFPEKNFEVLILGAGIGTVNFFFDKIFRSKVNITAVEMDKNMPELGEKYFGFRNSQMKNVKWVFGDAKDYLLSEKNQNKYDMIISDINNFNATDGLSPPPVFFEQEVLGSIKNSLKESGVYLINLMARSFVNYNLAFEKLHENFDNIFLVENTEDLNKIHFCFKTKHTNDDYVKYYENNLKNFEENADIKIIESDYKRILNKIVDLSKKAK